MSNQWWDEILEDLEESRATIQINRSAERVRLTAEVFTPSELVCRLLKSLPPESFGPGKLILDPACGDGQFLFAVKLAKMRIHGMDESAALMEIFGVDLLAENVVLCRRRLGGGQIAVGNALRPSERVPGQTSSDRKMLAEIFDGIQASLF